MAESEKLDRLGRPLSPAAQGYNAGRPNPYKGRRLPNDVFTPAEVKQVLDFWTGNTARDVRNRALIRLIYWEGLQINQALGLWPADWDRERAELVLPMRKGAPRTREGGHKRKRVRLSATSREMLDEWWEIRATLEPSPRAPLFCQVTKRWTDFPPRDSSFRATLRTCGEKLGLSKKLNPESLRMSGRAHRELAAGGSFEVTAVGYLHPDLVQSKHPGAFACWQSATELLRIDPVKNAHLIGHECREALLLFADDLVAAVGLAADPAWKGPIDRLRAVLAVTDKGGGRTVREHRDAALAYWGTTLDLAHRQEHGATKRGQALTADDARRLVFHSLVAMFEWDQFMPTRDVPELDD